MKNLLKQIKQCPVCGAENIYPKPLITASQVALSNFYNHVEEDDILKSTIKNMNGVEYEAQYFKQVVVDNNVNGNILKNIKEDRYLTLSSGYQKITNYACPKCHCNISPLVNDEVKETRIVPLIGKTGASKTTTLTSIVKLILEKPYIGNEKIKILTPPHSFEYEYYLKKANAYPTVPPPTVSVDNSICLQPLCYILVNDVLLVFTDVPGENFNKNFYADLQNTTPLYLVDITDSKAMSFFNKVTANIHNNEKNKYDHEVIALVKSDLVNQIGEVTKAEFMLYNLDNSDNDMKFNELYCARKLKHRHLMKRINVPIYEYILSNYCSNTDLICMAALGNKTKDNGDKYEIDGEWQPEYLYDLLLTLAS